jgi:hypothetical protein
LLPEEDVMRFGWVLMMAGAALASSCKPAAPSADNAAASVSSGNYQQKIAALSGPSRSGVFLRAISDAGFDCQKIVSERAHAPIENRPTWIARCQQGKPYILVLQPGGVLDVTPIAATSDDAGHRSGSFAG